MIQLDPSDPPAKRRKYGQSSLSAATSSPNPETTRPEPSHETATRKYEVPHQTSSSPTQSCRNEVKREGQTNQHPGETSTLSDPSVLPHESSVVPFDMEMFTAFVGHLVPPSTLKIIRDNCDNDLDKAVNMYFEGTWKRFKNPTPSAKPRITPLSSTQTALRPSHKPSSALTGNMDDRAAESPRPMAPRYLGAFGVEGWSTRSGTNLLKHGDAVRIDRKKMQMPQQSKGPLKLGMPVVTPRMVAAAARRVDVIVRYTDSSGRELGRLAKESAEWLSTLLDQNVCTVEATCVYAPERLRTNDTVFLQIKVYMTQSAFRKQRFRQPDGPVTSIFEQEETAEEKSIRLRQVALVRLLQEINLMPTTLTASAAKEQREGLLKAAELDEKKGKEEREHPRQNNNSEPGSSSPPEEAEDGEELEQDQLDSLYRKAQSFDFNTPQAEPAHTFAMDLRPYQKQALHWMIAKEKDEKSSREPSLHPLWEEYTWPTKDVDDRELPQTEGQEKFYVNPFSGELSLDFPAQEQHCLGGILADEMGLGKTIQMLSLIHTHRPQYQAPPTPVQLGSVRQKNAGVAPAPRTTLVVAPMSLLAQWQSEGVKASINGTLKSLVYYGTERNSNLETICGEASIASAPDVVITSYGVVLSEFNQIAARKGSRSMHSGIFSLKFFRVILDEAHTIKNRNSKTAKACYEIAADHRWVLTGTPIVNRLEDLFSLVRFLGVEPWNNFSFWRTFITVPFESKNFLRALDVVQTVLEPLVMRRTKDMKTPDGQLLVPLPPKQIDIINVQFSETERKIYNHIFTMAKSTFDESIAAGTVFKAYASIFAQLVRLRQTCCHPILVRRRDLVEEEGEAAAAADEASGHADDMDLDVLVEKFAAEMEEENKAHKFGAHVLEQIRNESSSECPICTEEPMIEQTVTGCWHSACKKCIMDYMKHETDRARTPRCVQCREPINMRELYEVIRHDDEEPGGSLLQSKPRISLQRLGANDSSAKVVALLQHLKELRHERPTIKSVVFSQFTSFLSLIEPALERANMRYLRLDGSISQKARVAVLNQFQESTKFTILLISLKAGGVGLNLTSAKRVFMMDPWWSFAVEAQAIDRVHRMGQDEEVRVYRFIVSESVEERMLKVQERKKFIATSLGMMSDEEKKLQRIEDIKELLA